MKRKDEKNIKSTIAVTPNTMPQAILHITEPSFFFSSNAFIAFGSILIYVFPIELTIVPYSFLKFKY